MRFKRNFPRSWKSTPRLPKRICQGRRDEANKSKQAEQRGPSIKPSIRIVSRRRIQWRSIAMYRTRRKESVLGDNTCSPHHDALDSGVLSFSDRCYELKNKASHLPKQPPALLSLCKPLAKGTTTNISETAPRQCHSH